MKILLLHAKCIWIEISVDIWHQEMLRMSVLFWMWPSGLSFKQHNCEIVPRFIRNIILYILRYIFLLLNVLFCFDRDTLLIFSIHLDSWNLLDQLFTVRSTSKIILIFFSCFDPKCTRFGVRILTTLFTLSTHTLKRDLNLLDSIYWNVKLYISYRAQK